MNYLDETCNSLVVETSVRQLLELIYLAAFLLELYLMSTWSFETRLQIAAVYLRREILQEDKKA